MKEAILNQAGNWDYWSDEKNSALKATKNNTDVGEKLAYKNAEFRVWTIHLPAGEWFNFHRHTRPYFWTVLSEGKARSYYNDGTVRDTEYDIGDTKYFKDLSKKNYFIHDVLNTGDTPLIFSTVELNR